MNRKAKALLVAIPLAVVVITIALYILLALYYKNGFSYGTWINGVYCTGKGIEEINDELKTRYETGKLEIINPNGTVEYIYPESIEYSIDFKAYLEDILNNQNYLLWGENLFRSDSKTSVEPDVSYSEILLNEKINSLSFVKENCVEDKEAIVAIRKSANGYYLYDSNYDEINHDKVEASIKKALISDMSVEFDDSFLEKVPYTDKHKKVLAEWENLRDYLTPKIVLDMGDEQILIGSDLLSEFLLKTPGGTFYKESDGSYKLSQEKIDEYVDALLDPYDTYKASRKYKNVHGETVEINLVMYGTLIDHDDMKKYLYDAIKSGTEDVYSPKYIHSAYHRGLNDIGPTYIEIDMSEQALYFFKDGKLKIKTDIVTGKPSTPTPAMVTKVCSMSRDVVLKGDDYASPVKYWVPIYPTKGIGLHDASWQKAFGGDRWKTHGSHGCVNMILDDIADLYEEIEVGVPVIAYY